MKIRCDHCNKFLFESEETNKMKMGVETIGRGFIFKFPFLYTDKYPALFFCNHACGAAFYKANIKPNPDIDKALVEIKQNSHKDSSRIAKKVENMVNYFERKRR